MPPDAAGVTDLGPILITPNGKSYAYEYGRTLSDLYSVDGLGNCRRGKAPSLDRN